MGSDCELPMPRTQRQDLYYVGPLVRTLVGFQPTVDDFAMEARLRLRPPLKWAGGKRWLAKHISELYRPFQERRLVEPFCGGLSIALSLAPKRALLNDINPHLINFYEYLQKGLVIDLELKSNSTTFYRYRDEFNQIVDSGEYKTKHAAELFYYLNRTCYNGLSRFNQSGGFNVPFGKYKKPIFQKDFTAFKVAFANWEFVAGDFEALRTRIDPLDFIYADPPYDVEFRQYAPEGFSWEKQGELATWLGTHPGPVVISNQKTGRIRKLYNQHGFDQKFRPGPRMISCDGDRTKAAEVVATKNLLVRPVLPTPAVLAPRLRNGFPR